MSLALNLLSHGNVVESNKDFGGLFRRGPSSVATNVTGDGTEYIMQLGSAILPTPSGYSVSGGRVTVSESGVYILRGSAIVTGSSGDDFRLTFAKNGAQLNGGALNYQTDCTLYNLNVSLCTRLSASDYIELWVYVGGTSKNYEVASVPGSFSNLTIKRVRD